MTIKKTSPKKDKKPVKKATPKKDKSSKMKEKHPNLLTPEERGLSSEEASIMGKKGGIASVEARRKKKTLKERLNLALDIWTQQTIDKYRSKDKHEEAERVELMGADGAKILSLINSPLVKNETKLKAIIELWDRTDGKAIQKSELSGTISTKIIRDDI